MPDQSTLDPQAILASLGITDATQIEPVTGGVSTAIWRVEWQGKPYALRVFRPEQAAMAEKEQRVMSIAAQAGIPVPDTIRHGLWEGRPAFLVSWVDGKTLSAELGAHPYRVWQLGRAFGQMQASIHRIPAPADMDTRAWIEWAGDEPALKQRLYDLPSRKNQLLHLDYHPLNVMTDGQQINGVLDWVNAQVGDPRADFARTFAILRIEPYGPHGDPFWLSIGRRLLERAWRSGYLQAGGKLDEMALFYAWAGAVMIRDQSQRVNKPDHWLQDHHLAPVRKWRDMWKRRAGIG
ncbi:MAG: aminoglycoside phosphotransferase family protein [Anaerolineae bacterium]|nr:aminoglycoside phosphotransferase family protein [Anaerolineae bacterium]